MKIFEQGKDIIAKQQGFRDWEALFEWHNDYRTGELKQLKEQAVGEARRILYDAFKEQFPNDDDTRFEFFEPYIFVNFIQVKSDKE